MKAVAVAGRYARALAESVGEDDIKALDAAGRSLDLLVRVLAADAALAHFFDSPTTRVADRSAALKTLADRAGLSDLMTRFLQVVGEHGRVGTLPAIAQEFAAIHDAAAGIVPAEATFAVAPGDKESDAFRKALETMTGRKVRLTIRVDPAIVGGVRTRIGSTVYDGTVRNHLQALYHRLAEAR
ncbi:MAG TPA: ATP synthase F1 subunit delta [Candidatus Polarisedimenticolia bacterium]|nr:ATP synthase F1 subunit delta [Candidatus Polarisedimenticolia bacterium]